MKKYLEKIPKNAIFLINIAIFFLIIFFVVSKFTPPDRILYSQNDIHIKNIASGMAQKCNSKGVQNKGDCYEESFNKLVDNYNFSFAEQTLYALQNVDEGTNSCHLVAHKIAKHAVEKNPKDWLYFLDNVNVNACGGGFLHGVLEAHLAENPGQEMTSDLSNEICNRGNDPYRKRMCTHLMGHIFTVDTLDKVDKAVPGCDGILPQMKFDCLDGVFMEHAQKIELEDHNLAKSVIYTPEYMNSLEKICYGYTGVQASACWTELAEPFAKTYGYDASTVYDHCNNQTTIDANKRSCYAKGIVILATYPYDVTTSKLLSICSMYKNNRDYQWCTSNLMSSLLYYSEKYTERGIEFCSNTDRDKNQCFGLLGAVLKQFIPSYDRRVELCTNAPAEYKNLCAKST